MVTVAQARPSDRAEFIRKTYMHLAGAVGAFIAVEAFLFATGIAEGIYNFVASSRFSWLAILGGFALLGWLAQELAAKADSIQTQYTGLGLYVVGEAIIFTPLIYMAVNLSGDANVLPTAGLLTLLLFGGITTVAFTTRKDFSFLGGILKIGGFVALGLILWSIIFGFSLGL
ncbi:MAG: Bax inhibitor-1/YccA family protein, partial [Xenococcaceae cyanobacterium]